MPLLPLRLSCLFSSVVFREERLVPTRDPFVLIVELDLSETCEFEFDADCLIEALRTVARDDTDGGI